MASPARKVWLITEASSGFGLEMTKRVLKNGDIAVATLRKPEVLADLEAQYSRDSLLVLKLDVSKTHDITDAFARTREVFGRLDVVFNNAGYTLLGEIEGTTDELARAVFEVDFWGAIHVSQEAVKFFREVNAPGVGGRLIQTSSILGRTSVASSGWYSAAKAGESKFYSVTAGAELRPSALEAASEAMSRELDPAWNIKVTIFEPGGFRTNTVATSMVMAPMHPAYNNPAIPNGPVALRQGVTNTLMGDPEKAAVLMYKLSGLAEPPLRLPLGHDSIYLYKAQLASLTADLEKYESWSADINVE
ncbi:hypothetical protein B0H21DRAFT_154151, partial [Amylocystis lapponica]